MEVVDEQDFGKSRISSLVIAFEIKASHSSTQNEVKKGKPINYVMILSYSIP